jgi:hypothetical protein
MLDGKQLRALFKQFNEQYFGDRLPAYAIRVVARITWLGESGRWNKKRRFIEIQHRQSDEEAIGTLLHEMAHAAKAATKGHHTKPWKKEMIRLRKAGAPLASADRNISLDDWDAKRISRKHFRSVIQNALIDAPDMTLSAAIRWFVSSEGGPQTINEFRKKYPWVRAVFNDEKRERAEYQRQAADLLATLREKQT